MTAAARAISNALSGALDSDSVRLHFECDDSTVGWVVESASLSDGLNRPYSMKLSLSTDELDAEPATMLPGAGTPTPRPRPSGRRAAAEQRGGGGET